MGYFDIGYWILDIGYPEVGIKSPHIRINILKFKFILKFYHIIIALLYNKILKFIH